MRPKIAYDARFLRPETRHWGVGVVIENVARRLEGDLSFIGLSHRFQRPAGDKIRSWPSIPLANRLLFEFSPLLAKDFDLYWATAHFIPALVSGPSVLTVYDMLLLNRMEKQRFSGFLASRFRNALGRAAKILPISVTTANDLLAEFPGLKHKVEVVPLGYDAPWASAGAIEIDVERPSSPYVMMLGCHRPRKNLPFALATVSRLRKQGVPVQLLITGDVHPSFRRELRGQRESAKELGVMPKQAVFSLLRGAACLLFPSRYEGFGFPLLEAMAAGCPVLALDNAINREIAGDAAWLLPGDPLEWAKACNVLLGAPDKREEMREKGFENLKRFSWDRCAASYGEIFKQVTS